MWFFKTSNLIPKCIKLFLTITSYLFNVWTLIDLFTINKNSFL